MAERNLEKRTYAGKRSVNIKYDDIDSSKERVILLFDRVTNVRLM